MSPASAIAPRAVCITRSALLKRTLMRTLKDVGAAIEFADQLTEETAQGAALVILDRERREASDPRLIQAVGETSAIIALGDSLEDDEVVAQVRALPMNHVIRELNDLDETELIATSVKLLRGDLFGLHKYLAWGVRIHESPIRSFQQKTDALREIAREAKAAGARSYLVGRIESVTDELIMNALYDAAAIRTGVSRAQRVVDTVTGEVPADEVAFLRYACDGRYFAVSVQDNYGSLDKETILAHLTRARAERGNPKLPDPTTEGAGLGLYFILSSVTRFIVNVAPGERTEVICLFDMKRGGRDQANCARSLHIFRT